MDPKKSLKDFAIGTLGVSETDYSRLELMTSALMARDRTGSTILIGTPPRINRKKKYKVIDHPPLDYSGTRTSEVFIDEFDKLFASSTKTGITVRGEDGEIIAQESDMPEDADSKLDYKKRFKRFGDIIKDMVTGQIIPVRTCPKDIKKALGIR